MQIAAPVPFLRPVRRLLPDNWIGRRLVLAVAGLAVVLGVGAVVFQRVFVQAAPAPVGTIVPVQRGNVAATVSATGSVVATRQAKLVFANTGRIKEILVSVGDRVTAGQPLARLVSETAQTKLETARSQLASAQLKLQQLTEAATPDDLAAAQAAHQAATTKLSELEAGPTAAELQGARSAVIQAQSSVNETTNKLQTLLNGPSATDRVAAQANLSSARNTLASARAKLEQVQVGPTTVEATTVERGVEDARANLRTAQAKLDLVLAGPTQAELTTAQAGFDKAQADLTTARIKLDQVKAGASLSPEVVQAQATLATAEKKLHDSHRALEQLAAQLEQANADLAGQQSTLASTIKAADQACSRLGDSSAECAQARARADASQAGILKAQQQVKLLTGNGAWDQISAQKDVAAAQAAYDSAAAALKQVSVAHSAGIDVIAAQQAYDASLSSVTSARAKLDQTRAGATAAELAAAQAALEQAQSNLATAQAKFEQTMQGATDADSVAAISAVLTAQANVDSAQAKWDGLGVPTVQEIDSARSAQTSALAGLETARAKLAQLESGPTQTDLQSARSALAAAQATLASKSGNARPSDAALQQEAVRQAELGLQQAQIDLESNTLLAPFAGIVGSITGNPGESAPSGTTGFMTLVDPTEVRVDVTVDETDVAKVSIGKPATISFDALQGRVYRGKVISIAPTATVTQGVVNYPVSISIDTRNQVLPGGLTASATLTIDEKNDVLIVPVRAVRRQGRDQMVEVMGEDGKSAPRVVKTGVQNDQFVEINDGLQEGEHVVVQSTTTRSPVGGGPSVQVPPPGGGGQRFVVTR